MKSFIFIAIVLMLLLYLAFSFSNWQINPGLWSEDTRTGCAIAMFGALLMAGILTAAISENERLK